MFYFSKEKFKQEAPSYLKRILTEAHLQKMEGVEAEKEIVELRNGETSTYFSVNYELEGESFSDYPIDEKYLISNQQITLF